MARDIQENVIEWFTGSDHISCTLTQRKYISKVRKIAQQHPELVPVFIENEDGSIFCHLPLKSLKLSVITRKERTSDVSNVIEEEDYNDE